MQEPVALGGLLFTVSVPLYNTVILNIMDVSFMDCNYRWRDVLHNHNNPELFFVVSGSCTLQTETQSFDFRANDVFVVPAGLYHIITGRSENLVMHPLRFFLTQRAYTEEESLFDAHGVLAPFMEESGNVTVLRNCPRVLEEVRNIRLELYRQLPEYREAITARFQLLYIELIRLLSGEAACGRHPENHLFSIDASTLTAASREEIDIDIIEYYFNYRQYTEPNIQELAHLLNLSVSYTHKLIRRIYGVSFHQKLTKTRILAAQRLLAESNYSQERISEMVGYQSYNGFQMAFKRQIGMTPQAYRAQFQKNSFHLLL